MNRKYIAIVLIIAAAAAGASWFLGWSQTSSGGGDQRFGYVKAIYADEGGARALMSYIELYQGRQAFDKAVESGMCAPESKESDCLPAGYFISATGEPVESRVSPSVTITTLNPDEKGMHKLDQGKRLEAFKELIDDPQLSWKGALFEVRLDADGAIRSLDEVDLPTAPNVKQ